jgi:hypothetical protein
MAKRKQPIITTVIDASQRAFITEGDSYTHQGKLKKLDDEACSKVLKHPIVKNTPNESENGLDMLLKAINHDVLTSALIKLAEEADLERIIKLANSYEFIDSEWILQQAAVKAKEDNIPDNVIDLLYLAIEWGLIIEENEGDIEEIQALDNYQDWYESFY